MKTDILPVLQREMIRILKRLDTKGWVANHDGNTSVRLGGNRYLITPTAFAKDSIRESDLLVINGKKQVLQGRHRPFSEWNLHEAAYRARPDARAVIHAHCPEATALSHVNMEVLPTITAEAVVSLGDRVPMIAYGYPGSEAHLAEVSEAFREFDVLVLEQHGVLALGDSLEQAYLRIELVEHLAKIQRIALQLGEVRTIPATDIERLLHKRTKAGLGLAGRNGKSPASEPELIGPCSGPLPPTAIKSS